MTDLDPTLIYFRTSDANRRNYIQVRSEDRIQTSGYTSRRWVQVQRRSSWMISPPLTDQKTTMHVSMPCICPSPTRSTWYWKLPSSSTCSTSLLGPLQAPPPPMLTCRPALRLLLSFPQKTPMPRLCLIACSVYLQATHFLLALCAPAKMEVRRDSMDSHPLANSMFKMKMDTL